MGLLFDFHKNSLVELSQEQRIAADPDLFVGPDGYTIYISRGQAIEVHRSTDLWGPYEPAYELPDYRITRNGGGVPAGHYDWDTSMFWTFSTKHVDSTAFTDIQIVRHSSFEHQDESEFSSLTCLNNLKKGYWFLLQGCWFELVFVKTRRYVLEEKTIRYALGLGLILGGIEALRFALSRLSLLQLRFLCALYGIVEWGCDRNHLWCVGKSISRSGRGWLVRVIERLGYDHSGVLHIAGRSFR